MSAANSPIICSVFLRAAVRSDQLAQLRGLLRRKLQLPIHIGHDARFVRGRQLLRGERQRNHQREQTKR